MAMKLRELARYGIPAVAVGALVAGTALSAQSGGGKKAEAAATTSASSPRTAAAPATGRLPGYDPDRNAYFGDLHVHTHLSFDAYIFNVRKTPDDAYRFAKGEAIGHAGGFDIRLAGGPLDFTAVTDHAEFMGAIREANDPKSPLSKLPITEGLFSSDPAVIGRAFTRVVSGFRDGTLPPEFSDREIVSRAWREVQEAAARHNEPGRFTTFVGYEYTSAPDGRNLHRNVIYRDGRVSELPFNANMSRDPEDLWKAMDGWRAKGVEAMAIPHNSNGSDGLMFDSVRLNGQSIDKAYAELRMRNEPIVEMTQIKGTSDTHPSLSPNDEWANFEIMESYIGQPKAITKFWGGYVRRALQDGIIIREKVGANPFKFGFIGASDTHNAAPGSVEEPNYFSKTGRPDSRPELRGSTPPLGARDWHGTDPAAAGGRYHAGGASGLAGVWAQEKSREAIYAAMRRKETFATSGPRIKVRFFASHDFP
ncbi:MAG: DUF3604 domain-containing protein, partial [Phenylobacterium sp.]